LKEKELEKVKEIEKVRRKSELLELKKRKAEL